MVCPIIRALAHDHRLLTAARGLILQVVFGMEDPRVYHPIINVGPVTFGPLLQVVQSAPNAKVQLLHFTGPTSGGVKSRTARIGAFASRSWPTW